MIFAIADGTYLPDYICQEGHYFFSQGCNENGTSRAQAISIFIIFIKLFPFTETASASVD